MRSSRRPRGNDELSVRRDADESVSTDAVGEARPGTAGHGREGDIDEWGVNGKVECQQVEHSAGAAGGVGLRCAGSGGVQQCVCGDALLRVLAPEA